MKVVLILEDDTTIREGIKDLLLSAWPNLTIYEADNGAQGIELAILQKPSLIIVDGILPILTGYQLVLLLKEMESVANIPLVAVTAARPENPLIRLMIETCDAYLPKPFDVDNFLKTISQFLD